MALYRFGQLLPPYHADVVRLGGAILQKARLPGPQKKVGRARVVDGRRERNHQDGIRPRVTIAAVCRYNDNRLLSLVGWVSRKMRPPDLSPKRIPHREGYHD
jgi:hypothetical protein